MTPSPNAAVQTTIGPLDQTLWTDEWDKSINPTEATSYGHVQTPNGLILQMRSNVKYGGWLCKNSQPNPVQAESVTFAYTLMIDEPTLTCAEVIETDAKNTDANHMMRDGSLQFNITKGWLVQVGAGWQNTKVNIVPLTPYVPTRIGIKYLMDYSANPAITFDSLSVGAQLYPLGITMPARQTTWDASRLVTQLQMCNNAQPGGYTLKLSTITYQLS